MAGGWTLPDNTPVFQLTFKPRHDGLLLSDALRLNTAVFLPEAYHADLKPSAVTLSFETATGTSTSASWALQLLQNRPNPFDAETVVGFVMPAAAEARLRVLDAGGRQVAAAKCDCAAGYQETRFDLSHVPAGVYSCEFITPFGVQVRKMVRQ